MNIVPRLFLKGSFHAQIVTAVLTTLALFLQPLLILVGAGIALICMSVGIYPALSLALTVLVINLLANVVVGGEWYLGVVSTLAFFVPVIVASMTLTRRADLAQSMLIIAICSVGFLVGLMALFTPSDWSQFLTQLFEQSFEQAGMPFSEEVIDEVSVNMNSLLSMGLFISTGLCLLIGRYWQSQAFKPEAFGKEFRRYNLGKQVAIILAAIIGLGVTDMIGVNQIVPIAAGLLLYQGLALFHTYAKFKNTHVAFIFFFYTALALFPIVLLVVICIGFIDAVFNIKESLIKSGI